MLRVAIVTGSTQPGRKNQAVAHWFYNLANERNDAEFELVDIAEYDLALLDEPNSPLLAKYTHEHTRKCSEKIGSFDAYVFATPEYNHSTSAALKNAIKPDRSHVQQVHKMLDQILAWGGALRSVRTVS